MGVAMFERYNEKARRVIFFSRYEAVQLGASQIEAEHILLGLIRVDNDLAIRFFPRRQADVESIRKEIEGHTIARDTSVVFEWSFEGREAEGHTIARDPISTNIDLQLSNESKRVLAFAAEESEKLGDRHIGTEHLLLGLLCEKDSIAGTILLGLGLQISDMRQDLVKKSAIHRPITQITRHEFQPAEIDEKWMDVVLNTCIERGLLTQADLVIECERVAVLRQFRADVEALLRLLTAKGLADPQNLLGLALDLRDKDKLAEFIEKLKRFGTEG
jgi:ATP-dependent Clp protease ATP-binding subunit ClpC